MKLPNGMVVVTFVLAILHGSVQGATDKATSRIKLIPVGQQNASDIPRPHNGETQTAVLAQYGEPLKKHAPVGDPPITRWEYGQFDVYFEYDRVIHAVLKTR